MIYDFKACFFWIFMKSERLFCGSGDFELGLSMASRGGIFAELYLDLFMSSNLILFPLASEGWGDLEGALSIRIEFLWVISNFLCLDVQSDSICLIAVLIIDQKGRRSENNIIGSSIHFCAY